EGEPDVPAEPKKVHIGLGGRAYDILIGPGLIEQAGPLLGERFPGVRFGIVTDTNVAAAQLPRLSRSLDEAGVDHTTITVTPGEVSKRFDALADVVDGILAARLERGDVILAFGGGVIGDLAGFAAAITRRGMDF